jgi:hypothetical protein
MSEPLPSEAERALLLAWRTALLMQLAAVEKALGMRPSQAEPTDAPVGKEPPEVPNDAKNDHDC